ncbi:MAG: cupredoxin family copper-binding protein [Chloroflexia bacterium]
MVILRRNWFIGLLLVIMASPQINTASTANAGMTLALGGSRIFSQTGKTIRGEFLSYWDRNGGLAQQGYPISEELQEKSEIDGKAYTMQYFERAVFELHPELTTSDKVLLSLLGVLRYKQQYTNQAPEQRASSAPGSRLFEQTGKRVGGRFLHYWQQNGGLAQQGYPISEEFLERSELDGKTYTMQYFERAVFELHTENKAPYDVLLAQLGTFRRKAKYTAGSSPTQAVPGVSQVNVDMRGLLFEPKAVTVKVGSRVTWTQRDAAEHNTVSKTGTWRSPLLTKIGEQYSFTFIKAGTYNYFCEVHPFMTGSVIVQP